MIYTSEQREKDISKLLEEIKTLRLAKGHDYSADEDVFENLRDYGLLGIAVRLSDKVCRLKQLHQKGTLKVNDEKIEDTMKDVINYSLFYIIMLRNQK